MNIYNDVISNQTIVNKIVMKVDELQCSFEVYELTGFERAEERLTELAQTYKKKVNNLKWKVKWKFKNSGSHHDNTEKDYTHECYSRNDRAHQDRKKRSQWMGRTLNLIMANDLDTLQMSVE